MATISCSTSYRRYTYTAAQAAAYGAHSRSTIVALGSPAPTRLQRRPSTSASKKMLVSGVEFCFDPPQHIPRRMSDLNDVQVDNIVPQLLSLNIDDACFGLPYAQRYRPDQIGSQIARPQTLQAASATQQTHIRRAGRVNVGSRRRSGLDRVADLFRFGNRAARNQPQQTAERAPIPRTPHLFGKHATMPAAVSASVAAAVATNAQEAWRDHRPVRTLEDKNMTPSDGSTIVNSSRSSLDGANIFRVNGIATLTAHKPQLVTIAPVGDMYTILPSCA